MGFFVQITSSVRDHERLQWSIKSRITNEALGLGKKPPRPAAAYSKGTLVTKESAERYELNHLVNQAGITPKAFDGAQSCDSHQFPFTGSRIAGRKNSSLVYRNQFFDEMFMLRYFH
jgi:hypothetical protein